LSCPSGLPHWELRVPSFLESLGAFLLVLPGVAWSVKALFGADSVRSIAAHSGELVLALALVIIVHEAVHALVYALGGVGVSAGLGTYYAYVAAKRPLSKKLFVTSALSPLIVISVASAALARAIPEFGSLLQMIFALNALGSVGDLILTLRVLPAPADATIVDAGASALVCLPQPETRPSPRWWGILSGFLRVFPLALAISVIIGIFLQPGRFCCEKGVGFEIEISVGALEYALAIAIGGLVTTIRFAVRR